MIICHHYMIISEAHLHNCSPFIYLDSIMIKIMINLQVFSQFSAIIWIFISQWESTWAALRNDTRTDEQKLAPVYTKYESATATLLKTVLAICYGVTSTIFIWYCITLNIGGQYIMCYIHLYFMDWMNTYHIVGS